MARYEVQTPQLRQAAAALVAASAAADEVLQHPEAMRGRARACGDDGMRAAAERFAERWQYGLGLMAGDTRRLADQLSATAEVYEQVDRAVASSAATDHR